MVWLSEAGLGVSYIGDRIIPPTQIHIFWIVSKYPKKQKNSSPQAAPEREKKRDPEMVLRVLNRIASLYSNQVHWPVSEHYNHQIYKTHSEDHSLDSYKMRQWVHDWDWIWLDDRIDEAGWESDQQKRSHPPDWIRSNDILDRWCLDKPEQSHLGYLLQIYNFLLHRSHVPVIASSWAYHSYWRAWVQSGGQSTWFYNKNSDHIHSTLTLIEWLLEVTMPTKTTKPIKLKNMVLIFCW